MRPMSDAPENHLGSLVTGAARAIRRGKIVAFPTETYYGLAVDARDTSALARLFALKGRGAEKASALLVADLEMFAELCVEVPPRARELAAAHWPGPLTIALPARPDLPAEIVSGGYVAARVSSHPVARALVAATGRPITCTSANPAGASSARTAREVLAHFSGKAIFLIDGGATPGGAPSTLVRLRGDALEIVRHGAILI
jgi:L-threonylcarbamoyladenylate synthase